jgi:hypothetical protein
MHMKTYIEATLQRFQNFDITQGVPISRTHWVTVMDRTMRHGHRTVAG